MASAKRSYAEQENRHARKLGKECMTFLAEEKASPLHLAREGDPRKRIEALLSR